MHYAQLFVSAEIAASPILKIASFVALLNRLEKWWCGVPTNSEEVTDLLIYLTSPEAQYHLRMSDELGIPDLIKVAMLYVAQNADNHMAGRRIRDLMRAHSSLGLALLDIFGGMNKATPERPVASANVELTTAWDCQHRCR